MRYLPRPALCRLLPAALLAFTPPLPAVAQDAGRVLFIRGAERSGGFLEARNDAARTEQLADITNTSTANGNHGWGELAATLRGAGFAVEQQIEPLEPGAPATGQTTGAPIPFETMDLDRYDVLVFGSNNAAYGAAQVDAIERYIRGGGGAIFISDANFGSDWADASDSDQAFLDRFGLVAHQDQGLYSITRDEFVQPDHPIFEGVDRFDGEGVTPIELGASFPAGVAVNLLARAEGQTRLNQPPFGDENKGPSVASDAQDGVLLAATVDAGRVVGFFDRNTFFNENGAGTDITRFDNRRLATNLFGWAANVPEPGAAAMLLGGAALTVRRR